MPQYYFFSYAFRSLGAKQWDFEEGFCHNQHPLEEIATWRTKYPTCTFKLLSWEVVTESLYRKGSGEYTIPGSNEI